MKNILLTAKNNFTVYQICFKQSVNTSFIIFAQIFYREKASFNTFKKGMKRRNI